MVRYLELKMMYESALNSYGKGNEAEVIEATGDIENQHTGDKERSRLMLFRAVVHECDKMIRIRQDNPNEAIPQATEEELNLLLARIKDNKVLPQEFYLIYANSLFYLSILEDLNVDNASSQSSAAFLEESIYRVHNALDMDSKCTNAHFSYGRSLIQKVVIGADKCTKSVLEIIEYEIEFVFASLATNLEYACELIHLYSTLLDYQNTIEEKIQWAQKIATYWLRIVEGKKMYLIEFILNFSSS